MTSFRCYGGIDAESKKTMISTFQPQLLQLTREQLGKTQSAFAKMLKVSQPLLSKLESGEKGPDEKTLKKIVAVTGYPEAFFSQRAEPTGSGLAFHRKRASLSATERNRLEAEAKLRLLDVGRAIPGDCAPDAWPTDADREKPEESAAALRKAWNVPTGPISDLSALLENHGIILIPFDFETDLIDGFFLPDATGSGRVRIALNTNWNLPPDRRRFSLAHELGHALLHRDCFPERELEAEADRFASAFLAPAADIEGELAPPLTFTRMKLLKARWRMSMQSLVRRARDLGTIDESQYKRTCIFLSTCGYRKREPPCGIPFENPSKVLSAVMDFVRLRGVGSLLLPQSIFERRYGAATAAADNLQGAMP